MHRRKIRAHYKHMSEFETGHAVGLKEAGWSNRLIARHLCQSDAAIRRCWQKWVNNGKMQRQDGSGRPRATTEWEDRAIVRMAVAAPESTLSTIQRVTGTQVSKMTINRRLREQNLRARQPLRCLPLTPVHRQVRLQWCRERSTWNCADWGRVVFSDESRFLLCPDDRRKRVWRRPGQRVDPGLTIEHHTGPQQGVMVWGAISFDSRTPLVVIPGTLTAQRTGIHVIYHPTCDRHTSVQNDHQQATERAESKSSLTVTILPLTPVHRQVRLQWCRERSTWNCADWGRIVFSDGTRFLLCPDDRRKRVWRRPGQRVDPGLTVEHHTGPQQGVMVWGAISFDSRTPLVVIPGTLTTQRYVDDILRPVLLPFLSHHPGLTFQQDNARPHTARVTMDCLQSCRTLPWPARRQGLEWCRARSTWMTEWHRVVFSDESRFCLSSDSRRVRVWRRRGERSNPAAIVERPTVRQRGIMVWGAITYDSRSPLLRIQGTMTAQRYVDDVLRPVTLPYLQGVPNALYQQDNARPHTARISQQALQDVQMLPWPPYSPDLSPIEHVWDIIGRRLHALPQPRSEDELWQMVEREWRAISQNAIHTLIDSLPRRVAACIAVR
ncbi:hypothetical protein LAZ67_23001451, partial [Cordylochernes scorpioides]